MYVFYIQTDLSHKHETDIITCRQSQITEQLDIDQESEYTHTNYSDRLDTDQATYSFLMSISTRKKES